MLRNDIKKILELENEKTHAAYSFAYKLLLK